MLAEHCLPKYFRHRRFSSLIRQLNFYSFYRVQEGQLTIYQHSFFRKGRPDLLVHIKRRGAGKAKDPWFDPLAAATPKGTTTQGVLDLSPLQTPTMAGASGMTCYSPMSKPLSIENMSPALKPGMAQMTPPVVDLGASLLGDDVLSKRWEFQMKKEEEHAYPLASSVQMKNELFYGDASGMTGPSMVVSKPSGMMGPSLDLDIQDFLTDDCSINPSVNNQMDGSGMMAMDPRIAMVSRDCLKWDLKGDEPMGLSQTPVMLAQDDSDSTFENELLLDLANVEPEAWEVPLSPLNEAEDVVSWGDLVF